MPLQKLKELNIDIFLNTWSKKSAFRFCKNKQFDIRPISTTVKTGSSSARTGSSTARTGFNGASTARTRSTTPASSARPMSAQGKIRDESQNFTFYTFSFLERKRMKKKIMEQIHCRQKGSSLLIISFSGYNFQKKSSFNISKRLIFEDYK